MKFDYDLVILGGSVVGRYAAVMASRLKARVALIEPDGGQQVELPLLQHCAFRQLAALIEHTGKAATWDLCSTPIAANHFTPIRWQQALAWIQDTTEAIAANEIIGYSLSQVAAFGVDVIRGQATFCTASRKKDRSAPAKRLHRRPPVVLVNGRYLRSRNYLLAPATQAIIPEIEGLTTTNYRTIDSFWQKPWTTLPHHLIVLGSDPRGIELAQLFNRLGCQVTLIASGTQLLPQEDPGIVALLQAHLEAEGIQILTHTRVTQAKCLDTQTWIQAGDRALQTDALLLATRSHSENLQALNLSAVGLAEHSVLTVNRKLQTANPYIYACGDVLGGYSLAHLAEYEADVAIHNALCFPTTRIDYKPIAWSTFTHPTLTRIGLTEPQAREFYGEDMLVLQQSLKPLSMAQTQQATTGLCKLIVRRNGEILGAHCLAPASEEWMAPIALAMKHKIKLGAIAPSSFLSSTFSETLALLVRQWQQHRLPQWQRNVWESWFNLRRS